MTRKVRIYFILALLIAIASEIHFYPLNNTFRISLGVIILNIIGLIRDDVEPMPLILLAGGVIFTERLFTGMIIFNVPYEIAFLNGLPSLAYYVTFAVLFESCKVYQYRNMFFRTLFILGGIDIFCNGLEAFMRGAISSQTIMVIVIVAFVRSIVAYAVFSVWRRQELYIIGQEHQKRYSQLNMLVANVESELFYLKKSSSDIESVMSKCYALYDSASIESQEKRKLLNISKDVHEIKKDYLRVLDGFQDFVENLQALELLTVGEIFEIMKTNYEKVTRTSNKSFQVIYEQEGNPILENYLSIFTILNNLVDNGIAACKDNGLIHVSYSEKDNMHRFIVIDNAGGMTQEVMSLMYNPGFTTKYDEVTGVSSTGIGLTHVKNTVESLGGAIEVTSIVGSGSKFIVTYPKEVERKGTVYE